jgi:hypothetical protein
MQITDDVYNRTSPRSVEVRYVESLHACLILCKLMHQRKAITCTVTCLTQLLELFTDLFKIPCSV